MNHEIISVLDHTFNYDDSSLLTSEQILIYSISNLISETSQQIFNQFNLDFDRQDIYINNQKCNNRFDFIKLVMPYLVQTKHMDQCLYLCQQTIFGHILNDLYKLLSDTHIKGIIADSSKRMKIDINFKNGNTDIEIKINKLLCILDSVDPDLVLYRISSEIIFESIHDDLLYVYINYI